MLIRSQGMKAELRALGPPHINIRTTLPPCHKSQQIQCLHAKPEKNPLQSVPKAVQLDQWHDSSPSHLQVGNLLLLPHQLLIVKLEHACRYNTQQRRHHRGVTENTTSGQLPPHPHSRALFSSSPFSSFALASALARPRSLSARRAPTSASCRSRSPMRWCCTCTARN